jgi:hypothetical protein
MYNIFTPILKWFCSETELKYLEMFTDSTRGGRIDSFSGRSGADVYRVFIGNIKFVISDNATTVYFLDKTGDYDDESEVTKSSWSFYKLVESLYDSRRVVIDRQERIAAELASLHLYDEVVAELTKYKTEAKSDEY